MKKWPALQAFYDERGGERSPELDFGVMWIDGDRSWPQYRVSWVEGTGDFYAVRLAAPAEVELLGSVAPADREAAERALAGWAEITSNTLDWVRGRLRGVSVYSVGPVCASVCYPAELPLEELTAEVNRLAGPTGVGPWQPSEASEFANGSRNPCPCEQTPGRLHRLFNC